MAVNIMHLNADTTFLLTFSADSDSNTHSCHGTYSILIDPWLSGESVINHRRFGITRHNIPASIPHLSEIADPDLVIISQDKPDHCHQETLRQLRPEQKTIIAAEPKAAKAIKKWNHFDPARIFGMPKYDPQKKFSLLRFFIPPLALGGEPGEVTVAFVPRKADVNGLHNAIGITYQAPTSTKTLATPARPRPLSILYTPHGVLVSDILPYVNNHLRNLSALPLTALLHSFSRLGLPWYFGGNILYGASNGILLAQSLKPNVWLGAHDEDKINKGFWVRKLKNEQRSVEEVGKMLCPDQNYRRSRSDSECARWKRNGRWVCEIRELAPGESMIIVSDTMALPEGLAKGSGFDSLS